MSWSEIPQPNPHKFERKSSIAFRERILGLIQLRGRASTTQLADSLKIDRSGIWQKGMKLFQYNLRRMEKAGEIRRVFFGNEQYGKWEVVKT